MDYENYCIPPDLIALQFTDFTAFWCLFLYVFPFCTLYICMICFVDKYFIFVCIIFRVLYEISLRYLCLLVVKEFSFLCPIMFDYMLTNFTIQDYRVLLFRYFVTHIPVYSSVSFHGKHFSRHLNMPYFYESHGYDDRLQTIIFPGIFFHCGFLKFFIIFKRFFKFIVCCLLFGHLNFHIARHFIVLLLYQRFLLFGHLNPSYLYFYTLPVIIFSLINFTKCSISLFLLWFHLKKKTQLIVQH